MKLKNLEIHLQKVQGFKNPVAGLEQYMTPAPLAARFLFDAFLHGDLEDLSVLDLGCGTGMLSVGAALLGADVTGIDADADALQTAEANAKSGKLDIIFRREVIRPETAEADSYDTVIMNPPFGAQNEHADRPFIEAALISAPVVWGIFNKGSIPFITAYTKDRAEITDKVAAKLSIPRQFFFHTKDIMEIPVEIVRLERYG
ncbi:MAG: methyltransferase domain-containing protein [Methanocorpusculum parvum]|nr:methyltransferase domain-containing protein [Methanocorpusculum parvum]